MCWSGSGQFSDSVAGRYVQHKLSGVVRGADGQVVPGPAPAPWKGRNKPHRGDRAWVTAWSPEQIANWITLDSPR